MRVSHSGLAAAVRLVAVFLALGLAVGEAQRGRGVIRGVVTDASGAVVPGVAVTVTNAQTQVTQNTVTNNTGNYFVPNLVLGEYTVSVEKPGFSKFERTGITLQVDQELNIDITLQAGAVSQSVTTSAQAVMVDTSSGNAGTVVDRANIANLPVSGRNALDLVEITPGVQNALTPVASSFYARTTTVLGLQMNGGPLSVNNMTIDGVNNLDAYISIANVNPSVDMIQEFQAKSGPLPAEYGYTLGGFVSLATRSGTDQLHGSVYDYFRNNALDANSWANNRSGQALAPIRYDLYGGTVGGPVRIPKVYDGRNRTFFFFSYEGYHFTQPSQGLYSLPTQAELNGDFSQLEQVNCQQIAIFDPSTVLPNPAKPGFYTASPFPKNVIPTSRIDPVAKNVEQFYPLPNTPPANACAQTNNYFGSESQHSTQYQTSPRIDQVWSPNNTMFVRWTHYHEFRDSGYANLYPNPIIREQRQPRTNNNVGVSDVHTFSPTLINEFRVGLDRGYFLFGAISAGQGWPQKLGLPSNVPSNAFPTFSNGLPAFTTGGDGVRGSETWDFYDAITKVLGRHTFKAGADVLISQANNYQPGGPTFNFAASLTGSPDPSYIGPNGLSFATFLLGAVSSATAGAWNGESEAANSYSFFLQDDWRVTRRLTLNLGVRYALDEQPHERNNNTSNFSLATNPLTGLPGETVYMGQGFQRVFNTNYNDWAPRFGFAYDLLGDQKTVVRGGYAIYYAYNFSEWSANFGDLNGSASAITTYNPTVSVLPAFQLSQGLPYAPTQPLGSKLGPNLAFTSGDYNLYQSYAPTPRSQQWNIGVQHQFGQNSVLTVTYTGNRGTHLLASSYNLNSLNPEYFSLGNALLGQVANPYAGKVPGPNGVATVTLMQTLKPFPWLANVNVTNPHLAESSYHALLVSFEKRAPGGLDLLSSFTFSKLISDGVANTNVTSSYSSLAQFGGVGYQTGLYNRGLEKGVDPNSQPLRWVSSATYPLPFGKGQQGFVNRLIGGWQTSGILTLSGGFPLYIRGANNNVADRPNIIGNPKLPAGYVNPNPQGGVAWINPAAFSNPPNWQFGDAPMTLAGFYGPGLVNLDFSLFKDIRITERIKLQVRGEFFNVLNHVNLGQPNMTFTSNLNQTANTNPLFGLINSDGFTGGQFAGSTFARQIQVSMKLTF